MGGMEGIKGERSEQQSNRAENQDRNGIDLGHFDVEKVRFFIKNALCLYLELCSPCGRGAQFQKNHKKKWSEGEKLGWEALDCKGDGYMWGHGGAENRKHARHSSEKQIFEGSNAGRRR